MQTDTGSRDRAMSLPDRIESGFEEAMAWCGDHWVPLVVVFGLLLVGAGATALIYESRQSERAAAFAALAEVERELTAALPIDASGGMVEAELANPELAVAPKRAAVSALAEIESEHAGTVVGFLAQLRAAELQVELGEVAPAEERLRAALAAPKAAPASLLATAERLHGYTLEELGQPADAAQAYLRAATTDGYAGRADAYWQAGNTFERLGDWAGAIEAYDAAISVSPEFAQRNRVGDRLIEVRALQARGASAPASAPATSTGPGDSTGTDDGAPAPGAAETPDAPPVEAAPQTQAPSADAP